jgi:hypothetical protein
VLGCKLLIGLCTTLEDHVSLFTAKVEFSVFTIEPSNLVKCGNMLAKSAAYSWLRKHGDLLFENHVSIKNQLDTVDIPRPLWYRTTLDHLFLCLAMLMQ